MLLKNNFFYSLSFLLVIFFAWSNAYGQESSILNELNKRLIVRIILSGSSVSNLKEKSEVPFTSGFIPKIGFTFDLIKLGVSDSLKYPDSNYTLFYFYWPLGNYRDINNASNNYVVVLSDFRLFKNTNFLIASNKFDSTDIKFISGDISVSLIWNDFKGNGTNTNNLINFLKLKLFGCNIEKLKVMKKYRNKTIFKGENKFNKTTYYISVPHKNPDAFTIRAEHRR